MSARQSDAGPRRPLEGIRILDLTHVLAGPFATYQLALLGAETIKVEQPGVGDIVREDGVDARMNAEGLGSLYLAQNANKRCITIDIKKAAGRDLVRRLVPTCDVFVENYRTGALEQLGLGYAELSGLNPRLVYCSMTGFGQNGPLGGRTAYDQVIQGMSGLMYTTGTEATTPLKVGAPVLDYSSGLFAGFAMLAALFQRTHSGKGQYIDCSMLDTALMLMSPSVTGYFLNGTLPKARGNTLAHAADSGYPAKEGTIMIGAYNARQNERLWNALGRPDLARHSSLAAQLEHHDEIEEALAATLLTRTAAEWEELLTSIGVPAARVRKLDETLDGDQVRARAVLHRFGAVYGDAEITVPVAPYRFAEAGPRVDWPPERLGASTESVLEELGVSTEEIAGLRADGVI